MGDGDVRSFLERRAIDGVDLPQRLEIQQTGYLHHVTGMHVEFAQQHSQHVLTHVAGHLESDRRPEPPPRQFAL